MEGHGRYISSYTSTVYLIFHFRLVDSIYLCKAVDHTIENGCRCFLIMPDSPRLFDLTRMVADYTFLFLLLAVFGLLSTAIDGCPGASPCASKPNFDI